MSEPTVTVRLTVYAPEYAPGAILVESDWADHDRVVLVMDGKRYTVLAEALADAAQRARRPR